MSISVSILEDDRVTRESIEALIRRNPNLQVLATYSTTDAAVPGMRATPPDVAVIDINLPGANGIECVARLKSEMPELDVLMLTNYDDAELIFDALRAGANGYLLKKSAPEELGLAIEQVRSGGAPLSMQVARKVVDFFARTPDQSSEFDKLGKREHEILALLSKGLSYQEIADSLTISINTVRMNVRSIYKKLHVQSRTEASIKFLGRGK